MKYVHNIYYFNVLTKLWTPNLEKYLFFSLSMFDKWDDTNNIKKWRTTLCGCFIIM